MQRNRRFPGNAMTDDRIAKIARVGVTKSREISRTCARNIWKYGGKIFLRDFRLSTMLVF